MIRKTLPMTLVTIMALMTAFPTAGADDPGPEACNPELPCWLLQYVPIIGDDCGEFYGAGTGYWNQDEITGSFHDHCAGGTLTSNDAINWNVSDPSNVCNGPTGGPLINYDASETEADWRCGDDEDHPDVTGNLDRTT